MDSRALYMKGGGYKSAYLSGVLKGLEVSPEVFDSVYGHSSAAHTGAYFITGQETEDIWVNRLTDPRVYGFGNLVKNFRIADIDNLVDWACEDLDYDKIDRSLTKLMVGVFNVDDQRTEYHEARRDDAKKLLKGTASIPLFSREEVIGGKRIRDGGIEYPLPFNYFDSHDKNLILLNDPDDIDLFTSEKLITFLLYPFSPVARKILRRAESYDNVLNQIKDDERFMVLKPEEELPVRALSSSNGGDVRSAVRETYYIGIENGKERKEEVEDFLMKSFNNAVF